MALLRGSHAQHELNHAGRQLALAARVVHHEPPLVLLVRGEQDARQQLVERVEAIVEETGRIEHLDLHLIIAAQERRRYEIDEEENEEDDDFWSHDELPSLASRRSETPAGAVP